jgi:Tfp pilus assembly protein PilO
VLRQLLAQWPDHQEARELLDEITQAGAAPT